MSLQRFFCFIIFFGVLHICEAQKKPIDYRYKGGEKKLIEFLSTNIHYPEGSFKNKSIGYSITEISISPEGNINSIKIVNPIDNNIDLEVMRALNNSKKKWIGVDSIRTNQKFYIQVVFVISSFDANYNLTNPVSNLSFIEPVLITAMSFKNDATLLPESDEAIGEKFTNYLKEDKMEEALDMISELIKRNPFNKELYQLRMRLYKRTKQNELLSSDINKISDFADGKSLDEIIGDNK